MNGEVKVIKEWRTPEEVQSIAQYLSSDYPRRVILRDGAMVAQWQARDGSWLDERSESVFKLIIEACAYTLAAVPDAAPEDPYSITITLKLPPPGTEIPADGWTVYESERGRIWIMPGGMVNWTGSVRDIIGLPSSISVTEQPKNVVDPYKVKR